MSIIVISDGRVVGQSVLVTGLVTVTGSFLNANSTLYAEWVNDSGSSYLGFQSLGSGTVTFNANGAFNNTFNWMVLN